jgi:hypothetical protein
MTYQEKAALYMLYGKNKNLKRAFALGETAYNRQKVDYELQRLNIPSEEPALPDIAEKLDNTPEILPNIPSEEPALPAEAKAEETENTPEILPK